DTAHALRTYLRKTDLDPERLAELDERMALWMSLARRYKRTPPELPELLASWRSELAKLDAATDLAALQAAEDKARKAYMEAAQVVSKARHKAAPLLAKSITAA